MFSLKLGTEDLITPRMILPGSNLRSVRRPATNPLFRAGMPRARLASLLVWLVALAGWSGVRMLPDRYVSTARIYADADAVLGMLLRSRMMLENSPSFHSRDAGLT